MTPDLLSLARAVQEQSVDRLVLAGNHDLADRAAGFTFTVSTRLTTTAGQCRHASKTITLSDSILSAADPADAQNIITHELAHAALGPGHGHGPGWRSIHRLLGGTGARCHSMATPARERRAEAICESCSARLTVGPVQATRITTYKHKYCGGRLRLAR